MSSKKFSWKTLIPIISCIKTNTTDPSQKNLLISKQISLQSRVSLSDVSDPRSLITLNYLPNSFLGDLYIFTYKELEVITQDFSKNNYLGEGGFGEVYKGFIDDKFRPGLKAQSVAVKDLKLGGTQGHREWLAEVIFLGQLKHPHLVNLIGYCCEDEHRVLIYEYMERGNLEYHLFKRYAGTLPWLTRIKIALGAAKGLAFLHEEEKPVIYRDLKTSNILLDTSFSSKLSDFGLATDGPEGKDTHITTRVMGTEGYAAPEYILTGHLSTMSDVYSFGVVLLELITGRQSMDKRRSSRKRKLVEWARPMLKDPKKLETIIDQRLEGQYSTEGVKRAAALAYQCLSINPKSRPTMMNVVKTLAPLLDLKDFPSEPFVYIVSTDQKGSCENDMQKKEKQISQCGNEPTNEKDKEDRKEERQEKVYDRRRRGRKHRRMIKAMRSRAVYSDTYLYNNLGTRLYSPLK